MLQQNRIVSLVKGCRLSSLVALGLSSAVACSGNNLTCPAVVLVASPAVVISSVANKQTGAPIIQFTLSNFSIGGYPVSANDVINGVPGTNATLVNGTLACSGSCGFGGGEGTYSFTVSAEGRPDTTVTVAAKYAGSIGQGCSRELKDGVAVAVTL